MIKFLFDNTYFTFNNEVYKQTFRTPMGATISPILTSYVMDDLLDMLIPSLPFKLFFIRKYVDDIILALPQKRNSCIVDHFNGYDRHIQITMEAEKYKNDVWWVPFLDTKFIRATNNVILIKWYAKLMNSGKYLNYHSYHKQSGKINLVKE